MKYNYDTIFLSPHLDDVALSCGGQVYMLVEAGRPVLIVTVMAGDPPKQTPSAYVQALHDRWQLQVDVVAKRRAEDARACQILGADHLYWDIPDCIYRSHYETNEALYNSDEDIFGDVHSSEIGLVNTISQRIRSLPPHDRLVIPLGVGNHVDHQMTSRAAQESSSNGLIYYEEFPYAGEPGTVQAVMQLKDDSWQATTISLSEAAIQTKIEAVAAYESQLSTFFRDRADMEDVVRQYIQSSGGERVWHRTKNR